MKKLLSMLLMLIIGSCFISAYPQVIPVYTIPSYNISVNGLANFRENYSSGNPNQIQEKREVNVQIKCGTRDCQAIVWVYRLDRSIILGPYTVDCDNTLTVEVDGSEWGVLVQSEEGVFVDVWFGQAELLKPQRVKSKTTTGCIFFERPIPLYEDLQNL